MFGLLTLLDKRTFWKMGLAFLATFPKIRADWIFVKEKKRKTLDFIKVLFHFHLKSNFVMWCKSSNGFENSIFHFSGVHWTEYWKHQTVWSALCLVGCRPSPPPLSLSFKHKERNIKKEPPTEFTMATFSWNSLSEL